MARTSRPKKPAKSRKPEFEDLLYTVRRNVATITITVSPVNDTPVATDDKPSTDENTPVTIPVLANDADVDGDTLAVQEVTQPANGTVTINADGTVTYTPNAKFSGTDTFTYTVSDGNGGTDTATVTVTVVAAAPVACTIAVEKTCVVERVVRTSQTTWGRPRLSTDRDNSGGAR